MFNFDFNAVADAAISTLEDVGIAVGALGYGHLDNILGGGEADGRHVEVGLTQLVGKLCGFARRRRTA